MLIRNLNRRYFEEAGNDGGAGGGGDAAAAAKAAADKAAADKAAADKAAADEAAAAARKPGMTDAEHELLREVMDKKAKLKTAAETVEKLEARIKEFDGLDAKEIKTLLAQRLEAEQKELEAKGEFDKVKAQMREAHQVEVKSLAEQIKDLSAKIQARDQSIDDLSIGHAFANSKFIGEKLVLPPNKTRIVFGSHFERDDKGRIVAYDKPKGESNRAPLVDANGDPLGFEDALAKLVDRDPDKDQILRASIKPGAGSGTGPAAGGTTKDAEVTGIGRIKGALLAGALKPAAARFAK